MGILFAVFAVWVISSDVFGTGDDESHQRIELLEIGSEGVITLEGLRSVVLDVDEESMDELTDAGIADDHWAYREAGQEKTARITIGKPQPVPVDPNGDWMCTIFIENFTDRIVPVMGVGPVDALKNAMVLVAEFEKKVAPVTPKPGPA